MFALYSENSYVDWPMMDVLKFIHHVSILHDIICLSVTLMALIGTGAYGVNLAKLM